MLQRSPDFYITLVHFSNCPQTVARLGSHWLRNAHHQDPFLSARLPFTILTTPPGSGEWRVGSGEWQATASLSRGFVTADACGPCGPVRAACEGTPSFPVAQRTQRMDKPLRNAPLHAASKPVLDRVDVRDKYIESQGMALSRRGPVHCQRVLAGLGWTLGSPSAGHREGHRLLWPLEPSGTAGECQPTGARGASPGPAWASATALEAAD